MTDDEQGEPKAGAGRRGSGTSRFLPRPRVYGEPARPKRPTAPSTNAIDRHQPGDYTKLILRRRNRVLLATGAAIVGAALIVTLALLPIRTWFSQNDEVNKGQTELEALNAANAKLDAENQRLQTAEGIKDIARKTLGLVDSGEKKSPLIPPGTLPAVLPAGLPYSLVSEVLAVRAAEATAAVTTVPETTTTPAPTQPLITTAAADQANQASGETAAPDLTVGGPSAPGDSPPTAAPTPPGT